MPSNDSFAELDTQGNVFIGPLPFDPIELYGIAFSSENVRVIDGDTIQLDETKIRLLGIDAPEKKQHCVTTVDNGLPKQICAGDLAKRKLEELIGKHRVDCTDGGRDLYKRQLSYCDADGIHLNQEMVKQGYAYSYLSLVFAGDEADAKLHKRGLWKNERFDPPWEWRKSSKK
jgi:endonuclease YncB( thermonuclease family)